MNFLIFLICGICIFCVVLGLKKVDKFVPGCPSEQEFDFSKFGSENATDYSDLPSCYCDNSTQDSNDSTKFIKVSCYLSSKLENLTSALKKVVASGKFADLIFVSNMEFTSHGLPDSYFRNFGISPRSITISVCNGNNKLLNLANGTFNGLQDSLKYLKIYDCFLENFSQSIQQLKSLESLTIQQVFIHTLEIEDLRQMTNLKQLDLSINSMYYIEPGTFEALKKLEILILGPSNAFNSSIFPEINKMTSLKILDLSANSIGDVPDNSFNALSNLQTLDLQYNLIKRLKRHSFTGLKSLKTLFLTANLINYTEFSAFDEDLFNLTTLLLPYNRLNFLDSKTFFNLRNMENLDLSYNDIQGLKATLLDTNANLRNLNLSNNPALASIEDGSLNGAISLENLNLYATNLSAIGEKTFENLKKLQTLNLSQTGLLDIDQLAFKDQLTLKELDLRSAKLISLDQNLLTSIHSHLKYLDLSDNRWLCEKDAQWFVKYLQENLKNGSNRGFIVNVDSTECWMPLDYRGLSVAALDAKTLRPMKKFELPVGVDRPPFDAIAADGNNRSSGGAAPFNFFAAAADVTLPAGWSMGDSFGGFQTLAPRTNAADGDHLDVKTLVASIVGAGVALTVAVTAVVILLMKRRRSNKKRAANGSTSMELSRRPEENSSHEKAADNSGRHKQKKQKKLSSEMHDIQL